MKLPHFLIIILLSLCRVPCAAETSEETIYAKRVLAHLNIKNPSSACHEALKGLQSFPDSKELHLCLIKSYASQHDERNMLKAWQAYADKFPQQQHNHEILECMAWSVIENAADSSSPIIRLLATLGAFYCNDIRSVRIIKKGIRDANSFVRANAISLAANMGDAPLKQEVLRSLKYEKVWAVRLEAIQAVGNLKIEEALPDLMAIVENPQSDVQEKTISLRALIDFYENATKEHVAVMACSDRSAMRILACYVAANFDVNDSLEFIFPLLRDTHSDVREAALTAIGVLRVKNHDGKDVKEWIQPLLQDNDDRVSIRAAWVLTLLDAEAGMALLETWLTHSSPELRRLASGTLAATGPYGLPLARKMLKQSDDPYVKMNVAIGLISHQMDIEVACDLLYNQLMTNKDKWMADMTSDFPIIIPSTLKHNALTPQYPDLQDKLVRLKILNMLAIMKHPNAIKAARKLLGDKTGKITLFASVVLLQEGDEEALMIVRSLLNDPDKTVRLQAALLLALWGRDESAITILQNEYPKASRDVKEQILEHLGVIGSPSSIPFLTQALKEPYQIIRIIAAMSLIQCLNH